MAPHEEFLQLCAAATAGELTFQEQQRLDAHLESCAECRGIMHEYAIAAQLGAAALASEFPIDEGESEASWSVEEAEKAFLKRLQKEIKSSGPAGEIRGETAEQGQRFRYRPSAVHWREMWMSLAAVALLSLTLAVAAYRIGVKRGTGSARATGDPSKEAVSLEEQVNDLGHERAQFLARLADEDRTIADLKRQLSGQKAVVDASKAKPPAGRQPANGQEITQPSSEVVPQRDQGLPTAQADLIELRTTIDTLAGQRDEITLQASTLEAKVEELTELVRERDREIDQKQAEVAKQQDLLEHDRDIRELMGARDLYVAEVHDVTSTGQTNKTYGRIFFTKAKRLIFYAYDLDAERGLRNAGTLQAWGRRGPDKKQALNLGIFYEDNASKKRWVLKANDPKTLNDIDAVFVTAEPDGGSQHPRGKQLLFAYLRVTPNHP